MPLVVAGIVWWQLYAIKPQELPKTYSRQDASGLSIYRADKFVYFQYYLGIYPLRVEIDRPPLSKEGAIETIKKNPDKLFTDNALYISWGEHGKSLLLLADAYLKGTVENVSVIKVNTILFIFALVLLYISFELYGYGLLGILIVALFGSHPFQIYEVYKSENIFNLNITLFLILLAVNLPLLIPKKTLNRYVIFIVPIISGILIGFISHIRFEFVLLGLSPFGIYLSFSNASNKQKYLACILFLYFAISTSVVLSFYFNQKISEAVSLVKQLNPLPANNLDYKNTYHSIWHPIWMGFSDFDNKYKTQWDDHTAYRAALPYLKAFYPEKYNQYDEGSEKLSLQPEYNAFMRKLVLGLIIKDPIWYLRIIGLRLIKLTTDIVPVNVRFGNINLELPFYPLMAINIIGFLIYIKDYFKLKLILFSLPLSASSIIVHSLKGITYSTSYHYLACAVTIYIIYEYIYKKVKIRK